MTQLELTTTEAPKDYTAMGPEQMLAEYARLCRLDDCPPKGAKIETLIANRAERKMCAAEIVRRLGAIPKEAVAVEIYRGDLSGDPVRIDLTHTDGSPHPCQNGVNRTSAEAEESIKPVAAQLRAQVYQFILEQGERGATDEEVQIALNMKGNTERPRRQELQGVGKVIDSGTTRSTQSGRRAVVWRAI